MSSIQHNSIQADAELKALRQQLTAMTEERNACCRANKDLEGQLAAEQASEQGLRQICRDVYEVWAGSEGIPEPETAPEAYLLQLVLQMRDAAKRGLK